MAGAASRAEGSSPGDGSGEIRVASSRAPDTAAAVDEIATALGEDGREAAFLFLFASPRYDADALAAGLADRFPGVGFAGGTTAGEIGPGGLEEGSVVVTALPRGGFTVEAALLPDLRNFTVEKAADVVWPMQARLARRLGAEPPGGRFAVTFLDGMCRREEVVVAGLQRCLDNMPLVGGSCGDGLDFSRTFVFHGGRAWTNAGVLVLVHTERPFELVRSEHFEPTDVKLVVTECDGETRTVSEINAEPAAAAYAAAVGLEGDFLGPLSFASHPVLVRVGGEYYSRSIQKVNPDGSLSFFCAIDTGVVLTAARPVDLVGALGRALDDVDKAVGGIEALIGFDCVLRRLDAENRQVLRKVEDLYRRHRVVGFNTYGEQYRTMHLNQTFTGVAIGRRESAA
ncbi:FIST N-terminal domain-containing protein [Prosthecomicrobium sp. N25]|uniref:FIST N-terminal domain-containing protein n=1 Tax=Prosthecomicrobium sp. N25 TaxID=3129254 RepID=UPI003077FC32